jgi:hypothetical protein
MAPDNNSIITEDGQRFTIKDGLITGTEDPGAGLAYETGNVLDEKDKQGETGEDKAGSVCRKNSDSGNKE